MAAGKREARDRYEAASISEEKWIKRHGGVRGNTRGPGAKMKKKSGEAGQNDRKRAPAWRLATGGQK